MLELIKRVLAMWLTKTRIEVINQACYAAAGYANEQRIKNGGNLSEPDFDRYAIEYLRVVLPELDRPEMHLDAIKNRLVGCGADPERKLA